MGKLDGRTIVVTGAARGQGAAETAALVREGALVIACASSTKRARSSAPPGRTAPRDPAARSTAIWT